MGGAYIALSSKQMRTDLAYAWPTAEIAVMGPDGAVNVLYRQELAKAADPKAERERLVQAYRDKFHNPYTAADMGQIDEVIEPRSTRLRLVMALEILRSKVGSNPAKKHGLMPV
jgi:acetyl-CoA carboxylase carboxyltransferase component